MAELTRAVGVVAASFLFFAGCAFAVLDQAAVNYELRPLIRGQRSEDPAIRTAAVNELVGLRSAIADDLSKILADSGAPDGSKAMALTLIGALGLVQCKVAVDAMGDWHWDATEIMRANQERYESFFTIHFSSGFERGDRIGGMNSQSVASAVELPKFCALSPVAPVSLSKFPNLSAALSQLRSNDLLEENQAKDFLIGWAEEIEESTLSIFRQQAWSVYPLDVRAAAAHVLGEFRYVRACSELFDQIGFEAHDPDVPYQASLEVQALAGSGAFASAIVKIDTRRKPQMFAPDLIACVSRDERFSTEGRKRMLRLGLVIQPEAIKAAYAAQLKNLDQMSAESPENKAYAAEWRKKLESVADLVK